jgi:hypothetical protein
MHHVGILVQDQHKLDLLAMWTFFKPHPQLEDTSNQQPCELAISFTIVLYF